MCEVFWIFSSPNFDVHMKHFRRSQFDGLLFWTSNMFETKHINGTLIMLMTMLIGIGLGETCLGSISGHHRDDSKHHPFSNYKKNS
jgi:hypothetical protein